MSWRKLLHDSLRSAWTGRTHLPVLRQMEAAECGLVCLAMIGIYHGHRVSLPALRRRFTLSRRGVNMNMIIDMAEQLQLNTRAIKLGLDQLDQLQLPCILHWGMDHFVVLKSLQSDHVVIHDPAIGQRRISADELGKQFTGIALELWPTSDFKPTKEEKHISLRSVMGRVVGLRRSLIQVVMLTTGLELMVILLPFQLQWLIDDAMPSMDIRLTTAIGVGFLLLVLLQFGLTAFRSWVIVRLSAHMNFQWQGNVFRHLMRLPLEYFNRRHIGSVLTNLESVNAIQHTVTRDFAQVLVDGLLAVGTLVMLLMYSVKLTLIVLTALTVYGLLRFLMFAQQRDATAQRITSDGQLYTHFMESVRGIQTIHLLGGARERVMIWHNLLADRFNAVMRGDMVNGMSHSGNVLLFGIEGVLVIWLGVLAVLEQRFTVGMLFVYLTYKQQFVQRVAALIDKFAEWRLLSLHAERVADIVHEPVAPMSSVAALTSDHEFHPSIELVNVCYRYGGKEELVLNDISLKIEPGECVAITGVSGCGKTTLVKIMLGLIEPSSGEVRVSGMPLRLLGVEHYRRYVAAVMQDDMLFTGSIADNICFFDVHPDAKRIVECARHAAIDDDIQAMPMGYNTLIGDVGTGLSGGQVQRVLLARAFYRQPALLFLDEATSHLDVWNEQAVNQAIKSMNLTRIIVAHRPETIAMADRVIRLDKGRMVKPVTVSAVNSPAGSHGGMSHVGPAVPMAIKNSRSTSMAE